MADSTSTNSGKVLFTFGEEFKKPELPENPTPAVSYLAGEGKWDNYSDAILYECESLLRQFLEQKKQDRKWRQQNPKYRKCTVGLMYYNLFGCEYDSHDPTCQKRGRRLAKLMTYYSTKKQKEGVVLGKRYKKTIYTLSLRRYDKIPPYSLRLRVEWLASQGKVPVWQNMKLPKDDLKVGHARNPRVDAAMERRREDARKAYNERYNSRDRSH